MAKASGSRVEIAYKTETVPGTVDAPAESGWSAIRKNSETLAGPSDVVESGEIRSDRQNASDIQGNKNVGGGVVTEMSNGSHDELMSSCLYEDWVTASIGALDIDIASNVLTTSGDFTASGFVVGQWVLLSGFANSENNTWVKLTVVGTTTATVVGATLTDEANADNLQGVDGDYLIGGVDPQYVSVRKAYRDIDKAVIFTGCIVSAMGINIAPNSVIGLNFTVNGRDEELRQGTGATGAGTIATDLSVANPMDSFSGVALLDDTINNNITSLALTIENNIDDLFVVGSRFKVDQSAGRQDVNGQIGFYFEDLTEYANAVNHTSKTLDLSMSDGTNYFAISFPRVYYDLGTPAASGEGEMSESGPLRARYDDTVGATVIISRSS